MKRTIIYAAALCVAAFTASCKKTEPSAPVVPIAADLVQNYSFKTGTYWVFQKENATDKDSIAVTQIINGSNAYPHPAGGEVYPYISMRLSHSNTTDQVAYYKSITLQGSELMGEIGDIPNYPYYANYLSQAALLNGYTSPDDRKFNITLDHYMDSFQVAGHTFHYVNKVSYRESGKLTFFMYWAPNFGIIRVENLDPGGSGVQTNAWNLVKWSINK